MTEKVKQLSIMDVIGKNTGKTKEDEAIEQTITEEDYNEHCPYGTCDGNGMIKKQNDDGATMVEFCKCYEDSVLRQKLTNAKISLDYIGKDFSFDDGETRITLLKPKKVVDELKIRKKNQTMELALIEEDPNDFIKRHFILKEESRAPGELFESFSKKNLQLFQQKKKVANLILFGESGNGKTTFACLIGKYFSEKGKKVHFTTTEDFLNSMYGKEIDPKEIAKKYDVLILDEFSDEYHTNSKWAKKQIKDILKIRDEAKLMTICTSNYSPKDYSLLYGNSVMSLLKGTFFFFHLDRDGDGRVEKMHQFFDEFGF